MELVIISETTRVTASSNAPSPHSARTFRACPRAEATAGRYAPSSRKVRSGNPLSQLSDVNHGGLGMTGEMSVWALVALTASAPQAMRRFRGQEGTPNKPCGHPRLSDGQPGRIGVSSRGYPPCHARNGLRY